MLDHPVLTVEADCGEGPVWLVASQQLAWVDMTAPALHLFSPANANDRVFQLERTVGSVILPTAQDDALILATQGGLDVIDLVSRKVRRVLAIDIGPRDALLNDSCCDPLGNLWIGVTTEKETRGAGFLIRITPHGVTSLELVGLTTPNGMDWSPDGTCFYLADSPTRHVYAYSFDPERGTLGKARVFATMTGKDGFPDGLTVDQAGHVWIAHWGGFKVSRLAPDGTVDRVISLPVARVSSCALGGSDLCDLYITTASKEFGANAPADEPYGGALFSTKVRTPGTLPRSFDLPI